MRGRLITFEGGEGSGKSTQIRRLAARLRGAGVEVLESREPGGPPLAERIRGLLVTGDPDAMSVETEWLLMSAARAEHVRIWIQPALERGIWVLLDRYMDSTVAYQGLGRGLDIGRIETLNGWVVGAVRPDLTLLLDLDPDVGLARSRKRHQAEEGKAATDKGKAGSIQALETRFEDLGMSFHRRVREGFLTLAAREPERFRVLDAGEPEDVVARQVWDIVRGIMQQAG